MSDPSSDNGNRTVFRPSPLSGLRQGQAPAAPDSAPMPAAPPFDAPPADPGYSSPNSPFGPEGPAAGAHLAQQRLNDDDIPLPSRARETRAPLVTEAGPLLTLAASVRSGRARITMPEFHRQASELIAAYDRAMSALYPEETRMRARYALCATVDDIAQNLPNIGQDGAEWARRSLVVTFFRENIGGDRFWQLVDELLARPGQNSELIELFAACLAAGFEGRFRVMPDGKTRLQQIIGQLYGALDHPRSQSQSEVSPHWHGAAAPLVRVGMWNRVLLAAAVALAVLLLIYLVLRLLLTAAGSDTWNTVAALSPDQPLRLSRVGTAPPPAPESAQLSKLRQFLAPEIAQKQVVVEEDGSTVRVRTTVGQLFQSGSDQLEPGRSALFERIGRAVEGEPGNVTIEGHSDSDKISASLQFPDNQALSLARAKTVSGIVSSVLSNPGRISAQGFGDSRPIASNDTADGKALNRRVEIVIPRQQ